MMSSSNVARGVALTPAATGPTPIRWAPEEWPAHAPTAVPEAAGEASSMACDDERFAQASENGFARGYEQGFRAGESAEAARLRSAIAAMEEGLISLESESARWVGNVEENICALAVTVARHVIGREVSLDRAMVLETVQLALAEFPVSEAVRVRLHPQDLQVISSVLATDDNHPVNRQGVRWSADPRLALGSCLVEGSERIVDGRVDVGLERLYRRLSNVGS